MKYDIIFESHSESEDNDKKIASGHNDPPLSEKGKGQARALGQRYEGCPIPIVYCSDLQRSLETAQIAFGKTQVRIIQDARLREWDYGEYNGHPSDVIERMKPFHVRHPFPRGESLEEATSRIWDFLRTIIHQRIILIGHRVTYLTLEHLSSKIPLEELAIAPWHWQPGWNYQITLPDL